MRRDRGLVIHPGIHSGNEAEVFKSSLIDFCPRGFSEAKWELCDKDDEASAYQEPVFEPMQINVVSNEMGVDPFFEDFRPEEGIVGGAAYIRHSSKIMAENLSYLDELEFAEKMRQQDLRAEYQKGMRDGLVAGREAAEAEAAVRMDEMKSQCAALQAVIHHEVTSALARMEKGALEFSLTVARRILALTSEVHPEYVFEIIRRGLSGLGAATPITIRVSEQDYEFINVVGLPEDLTEGELGIKYVADTSIKAGCVIDTDFGEVDMELERMWHELKDNLYELYK
ncbi:MAG: FliH/SctL family protein [bacterium]|nr:FliH/SctL family protein [bacterium]